MSASNRIVVVTDPNQPITLEVKTRTGKTMGFIDVEVHEGTFDDVDGIEKPDPYYLFVTTNGRGTMHTRHKSVGLCELCNKAAVCNELTSKLPPPPKPDGNSVKHDR